MSEAAHMMSDVEVRAAIAVALGWRILRASDSEIVARIPGCLTTGPFRVPDWPKDVQAIRGLLAKIRDDGHQVTYLQKLEEADHHAVPRGRSQFRRECNAALETLTTAQKR